ncbi:MAG: hypothetical protein RL472_833 [Pseudomonadota bacterium]|jgi:hypothetical protein
MLARPERVVSESSVKIGHAYVSMEEGNRGLQRDALGRHLGCAPSLNPPKVEHSRMLIDGGASVFYTVRPLNVRRSTLYRALRVDGVPA